MTLPHERVYVIGGGPSLLKLTPAEQAYLNAHPATIALNKYLMYWELVGVIPRVMFAGDYGAPIAKIVAVETLKVMRTLDQPIMFYLNRQLIDRLRIEPLNARSWVRGWRYRRQFENQADGYHIPLLLDFSRVRPIEVEKYELDDFAWAESLDQPLWQYHGSLTAAINLAAILYPQADIVLLGVDMNGYHAFYELEPQQPVPPRYADYARLPLMKNTAHHERSREANVHVTAVREDGKPGVQAAIPLIREYLQAQGRDLYCGSAESLLVRDGYCDYQPILVESEG